MKRIILLILVGVLALFFLLVSQTEISRLNRAAHIQMQVQNQAQRMIPDC